jgi:hypothetical protein
MSESCQRLGSIAAAVPQPNSTHGVTAAGAVTLVDIHVFREIGHNLFNLLFLHLTPFCQRLTANCHFAAPSGGIDRMHPIKDSVAIHDCLPKQ